MIESCPMPDLWVRSTLQRVRDGLTVEWVDAKHFVWAGLLDIQDGPTSGSGYRLTAEGKHVLDHGLNFNGRCFGCED